MSYAPPTNIFDVIRTIEYEEALSADDERYVPTEAARGSELTFVRLARKLGWDEKTNRFFAPSTHHILFFGHVGSGKTTELRRFARKISQSLRFYVVEVDLLSKLDRNNLEYSEALMAMAEALLQRAVDDQLGISPNTLAPLEQWFATAVRTTAVSRELSGELKAGLDGGGGGMPWLLKWFGSFTAGLKVGASYKTEWRREVRNRFSSLADAFNTFVRGVEEALRKTQCAERIVFLLDGTDKLRGEDTLQFFVYDVEQLLAVETLAIYTAPLHLKYDGRLGGKLDADLVLPMIKLHERDGSACEAGRKALRSVILRRADASLFASPNDADRLVESCGGHPRELLRLLKLCCEFADERIDATVVERAVTQLAADYRRFLTPDDYALLHRIDVNRVHDGNDKRAQELLHRLALLEYNDGSWRASHPVIRTLEGYKNASRTAGGT